MCVQCGKPKNGKKKRQTVEECERERERLVSQPLSQRANEVSL